MDYSQNLDTSMQNVLQTGNGSTLPMVQVPSTLPAPTETPQTSTVDLLNTYRTQAGYPELVSSQQELLKKILAIKTAGEQGVAAEEGRMNALAPAIGARQEQIQKDVSNMIRPLVDTYNLNENQLKTISEDIATRLSAATQDRAFAAQQVQAQTADDIKILGALADIPEGQSVTINGKTFKGLQQKADGTQVINDTNTGAVYLVDKNNQTIKTLREANPVTKNESSAVISLARAYPDAGVIPTDTLTEATDKVNKSKSFADKNTKIRAIIDPVTQQITYYYYQGGPTNNPSKPIPIAPVPSGGGIGTKPSISVPPQVKAALENIGGNTYIDAGKLTPQQLYSAQLYSQQSGIALLSKEDASAIQNANHVYQSAGTLITQIADLSKKVLTASNSRAAMSAQAANLYRINKFPTTSTNDNAKQFLSAKASLLSIITRAAGEKGVLTQGDVDRISNALPANGDNATLAAEKAKNLDLVIKSVVNGAVKAYINSVGSGMSNSPINALRNKYNY